MAIWDYSYTQLYYSAGLVAKFAVICFGGGVVTGLFIAQLKRIQRRIS